jgi:ArsR family transcriptional regulator
MDIRISIYTDTVITCADFFKCLSEETRLFSTLLIHLEAELCVCELMEALDLSQPKVSRHLAQLKSCGILKDERRGQWVYYTLSKELPKWALNVIAAAQDANTDEMLVIKARLERMQSRPSAC